MKKLRYSLFLFFLFILFSCADSSVEPTQELINTSWKLGLFEVDGSFIIPPTNQVYKIKFEEGNRFNGTNDCNEIFGYYILESSYITFTNIATTKVGCGELSMGDRFYEALVNSKTYIIEKDKLTITYDNNSKLIFISE
jgi:heat shock protein HslJ